MAGVARLRSQLAFQAQGESYAPDAFHEASQAITNGSHGQTTITTGTTNHQLSVDGITTITGYELISDQAVSVRFGSTGDTAITLAANCPMSAVGISTAGIWVSNSSGYTASIRYTLVG